MPSFFVIFLYFFTVSTLSATNSITSADELLGDPIERSSQFQELLKRAISLNMPDLVNEIQAHMNAEDELYVIVEESIKCKRECRDLDADGSSEDEELSVADKSCDHESLMVPDQSPPKKARPKKSRKITGDVPKIDNSGVPTISQPNNNLLEQLYVNVIPTTLTEVKIIKGVYLVELYYTKEKIVEKVNFLKNQPTTNHHAKLKVGRYKRIDMEKTKTGKTKRAWQGSFVCVNCYDFSLTPEANMTSNMNRHRSTIRANQSAK